MTRVPRHRSSDGSGGGPRRHSRPRFCARVLICAFALSLLGCSGRYGGDHASGGSLTIKGSDTMVVLAQRWAEGFMEANPGTTVQVSGGGSGTGIAALLNGTTRLANASRLIKESERERLIELRGAAPSESKVALDAIAVYVHEDNPLASISVEQLASVFRGEVGNWTELGGEDKPIVLYGRENNSGTYAFVKEKVLNDHDFAAETQTLPGTAAVINAVARDRYGIGYGGIGYAEGIRLVPLDVEGVAIEANLENAVSGRYPLARSLNIYSVGPPQGIAKRFLDYALSEAGQARVEAAGYFPMPPS